MANPAFKVNQPGREEMDGSLIILYDLMIPMLSIRFRFSDPMPRSPLISVRALGIREGMPPCIVRRPGGTGDYLFMIFRDEITIGDAPAAAVYPPGTLMLWEPDDAHFYGNPSRKWLHSWVHCEGSAVQKILRSTALPLRTPLRLTDPSRCDKYLFDLHEELSLRANPDPTIAANILENWLREIARQLSSPSHNVPVPAEFLAVKNFVEAQYAARLTLAKLADRVGLSVPHFCARFKQLFGAAPIAYLLHVRLHTAASLLRDTSLSVAEVGRRVGYRDIYYFSRHFKRQFGMGPRRFRQSPH
ncbi:hypothetical protein BH10PLA1_BH10PLA1_16480 [soil metagenome]